MRSLPYMMLAPNGARRGRADHPNLPVSIGDTVEATRSAVLAGADGLHLHVRDAAGEHSLDVGLYQEAVAAVAEACPGLPIQVTTEAAGRYSPKQQIALVDSLGPGAASVALRELLADGAVVPAKEAFLRWSERGIAIQHILYAPGDFRELIGVLGADAVSRAQLLFVLGRYAPARDGRVQDLDGFVAILRSLPATPDWAACAFGPGETECLLAAHVAGGKLRVGFENNLVNSDGRLATDNAERVADLRKALRQGVAGRFVHSGSASGSTGVSAVVDH